MKELSKLAFIVLAGAALSRPAFAQEETPAAGEEPQAEAPAEQAPKTAPAAKKPAAKKKKAKKKKPAPVSEYKFQSAEETPTYKFDKKAEPILKPVKKKKKAAVKNDGAGQPASMPKLKKVKSFGEEDKPEGGEMPALPPGMKIPGMGGN